jgi:hypothetical protein
MRQVSEMGVLEIGSGFSNIKDIVWIKAGHPKKHTPSDAKEGGLYLNVIIDDRDADGNAEYGYFIGVFGETNHGWFRIHCKSWKTKRTPVSYNNSTKIIKFMGYDGKYYSFKLKPVVFTKAKKIIDSYNKKWDAKDLAKKNVSKKKTTTKKAKSPAKKKAVKKVARKKTVTKKKTIYRGKRKSPSTSATSVNVGKTMRGGDGKMYVCKSYKRGNKRVKRWVKA